MKRATSLVIGLVFLMSVAAFAQSSKAKEPKAKAAVTRQASGTVSSVEADKLVLSHKVKGKEEETTFILNDQTKKEGDLKAGERVTVHYKAENGSNVATMVKVAASMAKSRKK
jgi:hypothetical protein